MGGKLIVRIILEIYILFMTVSQSEHFNLPPNHPRGAFKSKRIKKSPLGDLGVNN